MITVRLNDYPIQLKENVSLQQLLDARQYQLKGIAAAINNTVIGKSDWPSTLLKNGDTILIIKASQGG